MTGAMPRPYYMRACMLGLFGVPVPKPPRDFMQYPKDLTVCLGRPDIDRARQDEHSWNQLEEDEQGYLRAVVQTMAHTVGQHAGLALSQVNKRFACRWPTRRTPSASSVANANAPTVPHSSRMCGAA